MTNRFIGFPTFPARAIAIDALRVGLTAVLLATFLVGTPLLAQETNDPPPRRHFVGSSAFMLANVFLSDPPDFYQMNYGYRLTSRDVISVEAITWKYDAPLGIPYGPSHGSPDEAYPGHVREFGIGAAYQRFLWRDLYSGIHALPLLQRYFDEEGDRIENGFQLFLTLRFGYQVRLLGDRFFIEPSIAFTHWPIRTDAPPAFAEKDAKWSNYFLFEPGFHFGVAF